MGLFHMGHLRSQCVTYDIRCVGSTPLLGMIVDDLAWFISVDPPGNMEKKLKKSQIWLNNKQLGTMSDETPEVLIEIWIFNPQKQWVGLVVPMKPIRWDFAGSLVTEVLITAKAGFPCGYPASWRKIMQDSTALNPLEPNGKKVSWFFYGTELFIFVFSY